MIDLNKEELLKEARAMYTYFPGAYGSRMLTIIEMLCKPAWMPIETAPEETAILVYGIWEGELNGCNDEPAVWKARFAYEKWWVEGGEYYAQNVINPTHWMPLPEPPKETA